MISVSVIYTVCLPEPLAQGRQHLWAKGYGRYIYIYDVDWHRNYTVPPDDENRCGSGNVSLLTIQHPMRLLAQGSFTEIVSGVCVLCVQYCLCFALCVSLCSSKWYLDVVSIHKTALKTRGTCLLLVDRVQFSGTKVRAPQFCILYRHS
jgi:hypothetical protein